jgi:hypothetical protein
MPADPPPRLLLRWESLSVPAQIAVAGPVIVAVLFVGHVAMLDQPLGRGFLYALFWGVPFTGIVIAATRNEARRRLDTGGAGPSREPPS